MMDETRKISSNVLFTAIEELLAENWQAVFTVTGMSMWPFLCHGRDQVVLKRCDLDKLKKGDVVLFQTPLGNYMLHRITRLKGEQFETTGDGNCFRDGLFPRNCVKAKACSFIRKGKTISCDEPLWQMIFDIWSFLYPIRRYLLWGLRGLSHVKAWVRNRFSVCN